MLPGIDATNAAFLYLETCSYFFRQKSAALA
jgi:hypothetical protein